MKKLILLALVALVAGAAFAETAPAFGGDFEYTTQFDFDDEAYAASSSPDASINLNGVVDEWSTVNAEIETDTAVTWNDINENEVIEAGELETGSAFLAVNQFTLTTDVTGALGVDGPVGVSITWGALTFQADDYSGKAGYGDIEVPEETNTYIGAELTFAIVEKVNLIVSIAPSTYTDWDDAGPDDAVFGIEAQFMVVDGLDLNAWYITDTNAGFNQIGLTAGYGSDMINVGAAFAMDLEADTTGFGVSVQYIMDALTAGVAFKAGGLSDTVDFVDVASFDVNLTFVAVPDVLDLFAAVAVPFADISDNLGFEAGLDFFLGATTYTLGYEYNTVDFNSPDNGADDGLFFKVFAEF